MRTITLTLPDYVVLESNEILLLVAARLYERGTLSLGQAAEMAGISKQEFAGQLARYDVSIFNYPASEISRDVKNA